MMLSDADALAFAARSREVGQIVAFKEHFPWFHEEQQRTRNERDALLRVKENAILHVMATEALSRTEAEKFLSKV